MIFHLANAKLNTYALIASHQIKLFEAVSARSGVTLEELCNELKIKERPMQALLSLCAANNLLMLDNNHRYHVTELTKQYLLRKSPFEWGAMIDMVVKNPNALSFEYFNQIVATDKTQIYGDDTLFERNEINSELAAAFTHAMHGKSSAASLHWPKQVDLSQQKVFLDIAGGSSAHSISAVREFRNLRAIVLERPEVCTVAKEYVAKEELSHRIEVMECNMWDDPFPPADVHFYCDVFHDWSVKRCSLLAKKSFDSLNKGGVILLHELLFNDDKTGPMSTALYNMVMLMWTDGQQFSMSEIASLLRDTGFIDVQIIKTGYGDWSLVMGTKP